MNNQRGSYGTYQQPYAGSTNPTIKNPSAQFEKGPEFSDRDRLNDMLATEKYLTDGFNVFVREASHKNLFDDVLQILNETHHAADVFNLMFQKGWYSLHPEQPATWPNTIRSFQATKASSHPKPGSYQSGSMYQTRDY